MATESHTTDIKEKKTDWQDPDDEREDEWDISTYFQNLSKAESHASDQENKSSSAPTIDEDSDLAPHYWMCFWALFAAMDYYTFIPLINTSEPRKLVGSGASCNAYAWQLKNDAKLPTSIASRIPESNRMVVFKVYRQQPPSFAEALSSHVWRELVVELAMNMVSELRDHENITLPLAFEFGPNCHVYEDMTPFFPIPVYCSSDYGTLTHVLQRIDMRKLRARRGFAEQICLDVGRGLQSLHKFRLCHNDVKNDNVLVFSHPQRSIQAKIADFGFVSAVRDKTPGFTYLYAAPELLQLSRGRQPVAVDGALADAYSFGLLIWSVASDNPFPFDLDAIRHEIASGRFHSVDALKNDSSNGLLSAIESSLYMTANFGERMGLLQAIRQLCLHEPGERSLRDAMLSLGGGGIETVDVNSVHTPIGLHSHLFQGLGPFNLCKSDIQDTSESLSFPETLFLASIPRLAEPRMYHVRPLWDRIHKGLLNLLPAIPRSTSIGRARVARAACYTLCRLHLSPLVPRPEFPCELDELLDTAYNIEVSWSLPRISKILRHRVRVALNGTQPELSTQIWTRKDLSIAVDSIGIPPVFFHFNGKVSDSPRAPSDIIHETHGGLLTTFPEYDPLFDTEHIISAADEKVHYLSYLENLVSQGIDLHELRLDDLGRSVLHFAAAKVLPTLASMPLDQYSFPVNQYSADGWTALHIASSRGAADVIEVLIQRGADPSLETPDGRIPFDVLNVSDVVAEKVIPLLMGNVPLTSARRLQHMCQAIRTQRPGNLRALINLGPVSSEDWCSLAPVAWMFHWGFEEVAALRPEDTEFPVYTLLEYAFGMDIWKRVLLHGKEYKTVLDRLCRFTFESYWEKLVSQSSFHPLSILNNVWIAGAVDVLPLLYDIGEMLDALQPGSGRLFQYQDLASLVPLTHNPTLRVLEEVRGRCNVQNLPPQASAVVAERLCCGSGSHIQPTARLEWLSWLRTKGQTSTTWNICGSLLNKDFESARFLLSTWSYDFDSVRDVIMLGSRASGLFSLFLQQLDQHTPQGSRHLVNLRDGKGENLLQLVAEGKICGLFSGVDGMASSGVPRLLLHLFCEYGNTRALRKVLYGAIMEQNLRFVSMFLEETSNENLADIDIYPMVICILLSKLRTIAALRTQHERFGLDYDNLQGLLDERLPRFNIAVAEKSCMQDGILRMLVAKFRTGQLSSALLGHQNTAQQFQALVQALVDLNMQSISIELRCGANLVDLALIEPSMFRVYTCCKALRQAAALVYYSSADPDPPVSHAGNDERSQTSLEAITLSTSIKSLLLPPDRTVQTGPSTFVNDSHKLRTVARESLDNLLSNTQSVSVMASPGHRERVMQWMLLHWDVPELGADGEAPVHAGGDSVSNTSLYPPSEYLGIIQDLAEQSRSRATILSSTSGINPSGESNIRLDFIGDNIPMSFDQRANGTEVCHALLGKPPPTIDDFVQICSRYQTLHDIALNSWAKDSISIYREIFGDSDLPGENSTLVSALKTVRDENSNSELEAIVRRLTVPRIVIRECLQPDCQSTGLRVDRVPSSFLPAYIYCCHVIEILVCEGSQTSQDDATGRAVTRIIAQPILTLKSGTPSANNLSLHLRCLLGWLYMQFGQLKKSGIALTTALADCEGVFPVGSMMHIQTELDLALTGALQGTTPDPRFEALTALLWDTFSEPVPSNDGVPGSGYAASSSGVHKSAYKSDSLYSSLQLWNFGRPFDDQSEVEWHEEPSLAFRLYSQRFSPAFYRPDLRCYLCLILYLTEIKVLEKHGGVPAVQGGTEDEWRGVLGRARTWAVSELHTLLGWRESPAWEDLDMSPMYFIRLRAMVSAFNNATLPGFD